MNAWLRRHRYLADLVERSGRTFVQAAIGAIVAAGGFGVAVWKAAGVAGGIAVLTALLAKLSGAPDSASLLPSNVDPPQTK